MDNLFYTEAYVLSSLRNLKDDADIDHITNLLLGFYVCRFIGIVAKTQRDDFIKKIENVQREGEYLSILDKLRDLALVESKKTTSFHGFIVNDIATKNNKISSIDEMIYPSDMNLSSYNPIGVIPAQAGIHKKVVLFQQVSMDPRLRGNDNRGKDNKVSSCHRSISRKSISIFIEKMISLLHVKKKKHSKYEVRFFWLAEHTPEVYDLFDNIFNEKDYNYKLTNDKYILIDNNDNLKFRKDELQLKICSQSICNINQFAKKKIIKFPIKGEEIKKFLHQKILSDSAVFNTSEDLLMNLSNFPGNVCVEVIKERYVRKMEDHTKIEFSVIKIQGKEWKTICIESKRFEKVLALSLLVNQKNAEKLSYNQFLHQYGLSPYETK